jgi:hypothetical protein
MHCKRNHESAQITLKEYPKYFKYYLHNDKL